MLTLFHSRSLLIALSLLACPLLRAQTRILVDLTKKHQTIEGFGSCLISWQPEMEQLYATPAFQNAYIEQLGASVVRINLWGTCLPEPVLDWHDISYERFHLGSDAHRVMMFINAARRFRSVDPLIRFIGTVWSPPAWMKKNDSIWDTSPGAIDGTAYVYNGRAFDNRVRKHFYPHFVKWMVEMAKLHRSHGVPLHAISPGNEVMFTQTFESCVWTAADFAEIVSLLGKRLEQEGLGDVLIYGPETMTGAIWGKGIANEAYVRAIEDHPDARRYLTRWATHGYTDGFTPDPSPGSARAFWRLIEQSGKPFWITEGGTGSHEWPAALHGIGAMIHRSLVEGNVSAFLAWQATETSANEHGLMVGDRLTGKSRAAQHYFKLVRPGAVRVETMPASGAVPASAFLHEADDTLTVVLANPQRSQQRVRLALVGAQNLREVQVHRTSASEKWQQLDPIAVARGEIQLELPAESLVTLYGKPVH